MSTSKKNQSALRAALRQEDAAVVERLPEVAAAQAQDAAKPAVRARKQTRAAAVKNVPVGEKTVDAKAVPTRGAAAAAPVAPQAIAAKSPARAVAAKTAPEKRDPAKVQAAVSVTPKTATPKTTAAKTTAAKTTAAKTTAAKTTAAKTTAAKTTAAKTVPPTPVAGGSDAVEPLRVPERSTLSATVEVKKEKAGKVVRDSFSMPKSEHAELKNLRTALARAGRLTTKSEVLRAAMRLLAERPVKELVAVLDALPVVAKGKGKK